MSAVVAAVADSSVPSARSRLARVAAPALRAAAAAWFAVAALGLGVFTAYIAVFYGGAALNGRLERWNEVLTPGWQPGDTVGNVALAAHLVVALAITLGGALQVVPALRRAAPRFHRWNGRVFLVAATVGSLTGLWMIATRGGAGDVSMDVAISINALLNLLFAACAWRAARAHRYDAHRRFALRLFLAVNGGWFFRVGLMLWIVVNQGPVGFDPQTFSGPFLTALAFAQFVLPLALLELYLRAQASGVPGRQLVAAAALGVATLATLGGVGAATAMLWLPHL
jgi:hypothetical protein